MKKSLVAAAIAAVVIAPAANAGVVLYGKIHASIDYIDNSFHASAGDESISGSQGAWYVANRASRIGFKGTEDLGNGLSLIWKAETTYNLSEGGDGWGGGRNAYIGLTGDWGTFLYGRHDTPMKISTGRLDLFSDQIGDYNYSADPQNALLGPGFHDVRADNAIAYISPNWNGFTFAGAIVPGENSIYGDGLADLYSVAAMYSINGLYLAAAYEDLSTDTGLGIDLDDKKWRIGAGYTINAFTVNFVYEDRDMSIVGAPEDVSLPANIWQVSGAYDFGNNRIKAAYGKYDGGLTHEGDEILSMDRTSWAIGWDHKLSKRTTAYAAYASADNDFKLHGVSETPGVAEVELPSLGVGVEVTGFSMGLIHNF